MNIESLEVITTVDESLAQYYSQLHAIYLASDILKQMNILSLFSVMMRVCVIRVITSCQVIKKFHFSPLHKSCIHKLCRKTCLPEHITILTMENKRQ